MQVETLKATTGGKPITYKIAYGLPVTVMLEWGLYISKPRCAEQSLLRNTAAITRPVQHRSPAQHVLSFDWKSP